MARCDDSGGGAAGRTPKGGAYRPRNPRANPLYQCAQRHVGELRPEGRLRRLVEDKVISRFLQCGDPHHGFARVYCPQCRHDYLLAFSCKARYFCPSCHQKRALAYGDWVEANVLAPVPHRQYVFTVPRILRASFSRRRRLLGALCQIVEKLLREAYRAAKPGGREGLVERRFRQEVLALLLREGEVSEGLVKRITAWDHTGFSVHNGVKVRDADVFRIALNIWFDMWAGTRVDAEWNALTILPWCGEYSST